MNPALDVLAIYPCAAEVKAFDAMPPLGLALIAAFIRENGYSVQIIDQQVDDSDVGTIIQKSKPSFILIGGTSHSRFEAFQIAIIAKQEHPETTVVYGGPHATFTAENSLSNHKEIDFIVHGEGEFTSLELIEWKKRGAIHEELCTIKGISYRNEGKIISNERRPYIKDLDQLPNPARDLLQMEKYNTELEIIGLPATSIITARGCPIGCTYCSASQMFQNHYSKRSAINIVNEIEELIEVYGIKGYKIFDSTFTLSRSHVLSFCNELEKRKINIPWECEIRVDSVDFELLERMKHVGCYYVGVGIESADQSVLNEMHKGIKIENSKNLFKWAQNLNIYVKTFFSIGHINETYDAGKKTIDFIRKNRSLIKMIILNPGIRIYPGTEIDTYAQKNNFYPTGFNWSKPYLNEYNKQLYLPVNNIPILIQPQMGIKELRKLRIYYLVIRFLSIEHIIFRIKYHKKYGQLWNYLSLYYKKSATKKISIKS